MEEKQPVAADRIFKKVARPVWIVTAGTPAGRGGLVASWVMQTSIDPLAPRVVIGLAPNHHTAQLVDRSGAFALHLIGPHHIDHVWRFGISTGAEHDKLAGLDARTGQTGSPILEECLAWFDCVVSDRHDGGDRLYFWGDVLACEELSGGPVLTEEGVFRLAHDSQKALLKRGLDEDIELHRTLRDRRRDQPGT